MKKFISIVGLSLLMSTTAFANINITVDNKNLASDVPPVIIEGRTLVPVRAIFEELGADVEWNADTQTVTATKDSLNVVLQINNTSASINGETKTLDVPAQIVDGRTMVPARFVTESMGCNVGWNADTQTVTISTDGSSVEQPTNNSTPVTNTENTTNANNTTATNENTGNTTNAERKVYVTETGSKYHYDGNCGNGTYYESTLEKALSLGLKPCNKCVN